MHRRAFLPLPPIPSKTASPTSRARKGITLIPPFGPQGIEISDAESPFSHPALTARLENPPSAGLEPYAGPWDKAAVLHLLRRTLTGFTAADVAYFQQKTRQTAVREILNAPARPALPAINDYNNNDFTDPKVPFGQSWLDAPFDVEAEGYRLESLRAAWLRNLLRGGRDSFSERMALFWHNHLPVQFSEIFYGRPLHTYVETLRRQARGNVKTLVRAITLDPAMLFFLNGYLNSVYAPDENYAREVQELFVIGKDLPQHYTEADVKAAARLLTGWRTDGVRVGFDPAEHDPTDKQFSAFYGNRRIKGRSGLQAGDAELDEFLDMMFGHPEAARFLCRKIYRFFVFHLIDAQTEQNVIVPLADLLRKNQYDIAPVLETLFNSAHFFDVLQRGTMIKSPVDMLTGLFGQFSIVLPGESALFDRLYIPIQLNYLLSQILQIPGDPPNVAGWQAYYQQPVFDRVWINTSTLPRRVQLKAYLLAVGVSGVDEANRTIIDPLTWAKTLPNPGDPDALITDTLALLLPIPVSAKVHDILKSILLSNLPSAYYWTLAWQAWLQNPADEVARGAVLIRLQGFLWRIFQLEEYQLI